MDEKDIKHTFWMYWTASLITGMAIGMVVGIVLMVGGG